MFWVFFLFFSFVCAELELMSSLTHTTIKYEFSGNQHKSHTHASNWSLEMNVKKNNKNCTTSYKSYQSILRLIVRTQFGRLLFCTLHGTLIRMALVLCCCIVIIFQFLAQLTSSLPLYPAEKYLFSYLLFFYTFHLSTPSPFDNFIWIKNVFISILSLPGNGCVWRHFLRP